MPNRVRVYTFAEGLLSRIAHDLRLHIEPEGVKVERSGEQVAAELDPDRFVVDGAMKHTQVDREALTRRDRSKIVDTIHSEILTTAKYPKICFDGVANEQGDHLLEVSGELELVGVRRALEFVATREAGRIRARVTLRPTEWGIRPFKAFAGTIRLQDRVVVELDLDDIPNPSPAR